MSTCRGAQPRFVTPLCRSGQQQQQQQNHSAWLAQNNLDWSSGRGEICLKKCSLCLLRHLKRLFFSYDFIPRSGRGSTVVEGPLVDGQQTNRSLRVFCCRSRGWFKKESSQVFTFNVIGASCATLHSNQETLWHFNSQGNEWKNPRQ